MNFVMPSQYHPSGHLMHDFSSDERYWVGFVHVIGATLHFVSLSWAAALPPLSVMILLSEHPSQLD
jgi:hypothetical protein